MGTFCRLLLLRFCDDGAALGEWALFVGALLAGAGVSDSFAAGAPSESRTRNLLIPRAQPAGQEIASSHLRCRPPLSYNLTYTPPISAAGIGVLERTGGVSRRLNVILCAHRI
jgi:hypothetical protein